jgi:pimeloyl-ACP methyl ester carboxylesterase
MASGAKSSRLKVPGATLYYEVQGSGPVLILIPGGPTDAGVFGGLAACLADRYTVAACDPRGNSRSVLDGAREEQRLDVHGDDMAQLVAALGDEPAYVFGTSGGAQIGLDLAARHPGRVRVLVAHEPPCVKLLPDPAPTLAGNRAVVDAYHSGGVAAAMQKFAEVTGFAGGTSRADAPPPPPEVQETFARIQGNFDYFFACGLAPLSLYEPDVAALRAGPVRVVVGVGESSVGQTAYRTAVALAEKLGRPPVVFPGDHGGYGPRAPDFAATLDRVLRSA